MFLLCFEFMVVKMEAVIPLNVLIDLCTNYLAVDDVLKMYWTCTYWRSVIQNYNILDKHKVRLTKKAQTSCFKDDIEELQLEDVFPFSKVAVLLNRPCEHKLKAKCVIFKSHHSHAQLTYFHLRYASGELHSQYFPHKILKSDRCEEHRSPILPFIMVLLSSIQEKIHYFVYMYPMSLHQFIANDFVKRCFLVHVKEVVCVPRVLMLCIDLHIENAVVVFSTSRTTEIAVIRNGCVVEERWCEVRVGGWNISKHLYDAILWDYPNMVTTVAQLEHRKFKSLCWIKPNCNMTERQLNARVRNMVKRDRYKFKKEQYLAPELMYMELDLCNNISKLLDGLPEQDVENCLSHVLLTGGNCKLKHFGTRVKMDLIQTFPKYKNIIETSFHLANEHIYEKRDIVSFIHTIEPEDSFTLGKCCRIPVKNYLRCRKELEWSDEPIIL